MVNGPLRGRDEFDLPQRPGRVAPPRATPRIGDPKRRREAIDDEDPRGRTATLDAAVATFGASLKAKLSNSAVEGAPEDRLQAIVDVAGAAAILPWGRDELRPYGTVAPQVILSLQDDEAARRCADFEAELTRRVA